MAIEKQPTANASASASNPTLTAHPAPASKTTAASNKKDPNRIIRRRNRLKKSCKPCSERHVKCNLIIPCFSCIQRNEQNLCFIDNPLLNKQRKGAPIRRSASPIRVTSSSNSDTREDRYDFGPPASVVEEHNLNSSTPFMRFLDECGSSLQKDVSTLQSSRKNGISGQVVGYSRQVQDELEAARNLLPKRAADTIQMLRRCLTLSAWVGCSSDAAHQVGLSSPNLALIFGTKKASESTSNAFQDVSVFPLAYDTPTSELFPSLSKSGDAARMSLAIAMFLSALSMSSLLLAKLCYEDLDTQENFQRMEKKLEDAVVRTMEISQKHDGDQLDNTIRAGLLHFYYIKSKGTVEHDASKKFMSDLADMVRSAGLHRLDAASSSSYIGASQLEARRVLFYEYLLHDRMAAAVFGRPAKFPLEEITSLSPKPSADTITLIFRVHLATLLLNARDMLEKGATSYDQIDHIDGQFTSSWNQICKEYGGLQEASCNRERRWLTEACLRQAVFCTCRVMVHRMAFFNAPPTYSSANVWKSRRICFEAAIMATEMQDTMRYTMDNDELMSSFYTAWIPTEHVITLLLASLMALRETLADPNNGRDSTDGSMSEACQEAISMVERAKGLAARIRRNLKSAPPGCTLAERGLMMLNRVEGKADAVLSSEVANFRGEAASTFTPNDDQSLVADMPFYERRANPHASSLAAREAATQRTSSVSGSSYSNASHHQSPSTPYTSSTSNDPSHKSTPASYLHPYFKPPSTTSQPAYNNNDDMMSTNENPLGLFNSSDIDSIFWNALQQPLQTPFDDQSFNSTLGSNNPPLVIQNTSASDIEANLDSWLAMLNNQSM